MKLGCIADDYTGATDLAGLLARSNASVCLHFEVPDATTEGSADIEIIALKCRTAPVDTAVSEAKRAAQWLLARGAERLYWKYCSTFDSTATGNIGPIAEALMVLTGQTQALYCPAFPENGRAVFMGHLFVGEQLLSESSLKDHPLTPMTDSNLCRVLAPQVTGAVGLWNRLQQMSGVPCPKDTHVIADAVEAADLERLVAHTPDSVLLTGGSALAMGLPAALGLSHVKPNPQPTVGSRALVLSGSCSTQTRAQVAQWSATRPAFALDPLDPDTGSKALNWWSTQPIDEPCLIYATAEPEKVRAVQATLGVTGAGARVEALIAQIATEAVAQGVRRLVVAGGETSGAVTQALTVHHVQVGHEICPGVPWVYDTDRLEPLALALKSGNFGGLDFFAEALSVLETS